MNATTLQRLMLVFSLVAAGLIAAMFLIFGLTGIGQDPLQYVRLPQDYQAELLRAPSLLRTVFGLDNLFLVSYGALFVLLTQWLWQRGAARLPLLVGGALLLATTLLDLLENLHFLTLLANAEMGQAPAVDAISWQVMESMLKFHLSYLGLALMGQVMPRDTSVQRLLATMLCWVQWPIGVAIYVAPRAVATPLVFGRYGFFVLALLMLAWVFSRGDVGGAARPAASGGHPAYA